MECTQPLKVLAGRQHSMPVSSKTERDHHVPVNILQQFRKRKANCHACLGWHPQDTTTQPIQSTKHYRCAFFLPHACGETKPKIFRVGDYLRRNRATRGRQRNQKPQQGPGSSLKIALRDNIGIAGGNNSNANACKLNNSW